MVATEEPPNGKAIIDEGGNGVTVTITGFDISGAVVPDGNGAAIRYEGGTLILDNDTIHGNQEGLLGAADPAGVITVENSTFYGNGTGDGYTHQLYVGAIASLTVEGSTFSGGIVGHDIKSRAASNTIVGNTIIDGTSGTASYEIDLPNGGVATITGNVIEKGANAENPIAISYGEEGSLYATGSLTVSGNTILNDDTAHSTTVVQNDTDTVASITGNTLYGWTTLVNGPATASGNVTLTTEPELSTLAPTAASTTTAGTATTTTGTTTTDTTAGTTTAGITTDATTSSGATTGTTGTTTGTDTGAGSGTASTGTTSGATTGGPGRGFVLHDHHGDLRGSFDPIGPLFPSGRQAGQIPGAGALMADHQAHHATIPPLHGR